MISFKKIAKAAFIAVTIAANLAITYKTYREVKRVDREFDERCFTTGEVEKGKMTRDERAIYRNLRTNADTMAITPDGSRMYILLSKVDRLIWFAGPDFRTMNSEELNLWFQDAMREILEEHQ